MSCTQQWLNIQARVSHTYFCCLSSSQSQKLSLFIFGYFCSISPVFFVSFLSLFVLSCHLRFSFLFMLSLRSLLCLHTASIRLWLGFTLTWTSTFLCLLLPFTCSSICILPTVRQFMEMSCQRLSDTPSGVEEEVLLFCCLSLLLSSSLDGGRKAPFLHFFPLGALGILMMQTDKDP